MHLGMGRLQMSIGDLPLINILQQKMSWLNDRQSVLSRNIANASTPGYVPMDLSAKASCFAWPSGFHAPASSESTHGFARSLIVSHAA